MVFNCIRENTSSAIQTNDAKVEQIKNWESEKKDIDYQNYSFCYPCSFVLSQHLILLTFEHHHYQHFESQKMYQNWL
jgi:hypothetical protein